MGQITPVTDIVDVEKVGSEDKHTGEVDEGDEVTVNFLCENVTGEIVIDEVLFVKDKIDSELKNAWITRVFAKFEDLCSSITDWKQIVNGSWLSQCISQLVRYQLTRAQAKQVLKLDLEYINKRDKN